MVVLRGLEEIKIFQNSEKNSEVGGWVHGQLGLRKKMENRKPCAPLMISRSFRYFSFEHDLFVIYGVLLYVSFGNLLQFFCGLLEFFLFLQDPLQHGHIIVGACDR